MNVRELNYLQLMQLKERVFYLDTNDEDDFAPFAESWTDDIEVEHNDAEYPSDISDETIFTLFDGIDFVEEDFAA